MSDTKGIETMVFVGRQLPPMMAKDKRMRSVSIRLEESLFNIAASLSGESGAADFSDYVRGLLVADALDNGKKLSGIQISGWLVGKRIHVSALEQSPESDKETGGDVPKVRAVGRRSTKSPG